MVITRFTSRRAPSHRLLLAALLMACMASLLVPAAAGAKIDAASTRTELVEVFSPDGSITRVEVPKVEPAALSRVEAAALADSDLGSLQVSGPSENRIDLVIIGDGYTAAEMAKFRDHAASKWQDIKRFEPFTSYASYFNVWVVDVVSPQSGVDHDPRPPVLRDTALDMQFWCNGTERLLCVDQNKARAAAAAAPGADQILVLANSTKYGGAGGAVATSSGGSLAAGLITVHELGHSLGGLADEYDYYYRAGLAEDSTQDVTIPAPYLAYPKEALGEPGGVNITAEADPQQLVAKKLKWWRWVGEESPDGGPVGSFEGGGYYRYRMYRPTQDSLMHSLGIAEGGNPLNSPSIEQMVKQFYRFIDPVDAAPAEGPLTPGAVTLDVVEPAAHRLQIRWFIDDVEVESARDSVTFDLTPEVAGAASTLRVVVSDTTAFVRDPSFLSNDLTQTLSWDI